jgi:hypothetical protein
MNYVVVTTDKDRQGVFGGYLKDGSAETGTVTLSDARMAVYWSQETRGVLGLASIGPQPGSRITPPVPLIELNGVTSVIECTQEATAQWELGLWD